MKVGGGDGMQSPPAHLLRTYALLMNLLDELDCSQGLMKELRDNHSQELRVQVQSIFHILVLVKNLTHASTSEPHTFSKKFRTLQFWNLPTLREGLGVSATQILFRTFLKSYFIFFFFFPNMVVN